LLVAPIEGSSFAVAGAPALDLRPVVPFEKTIRMSSASYMISSMTRESPV